MRKYKRELWRRQGRLEKGGAGRRASGAPAAAEFTRTFASFENSSCKIIDRSIDGHQEFLESGLRGRGLGGCECQLQVVDDPVHDGMLREEGDDAHRPSASGAEHGSTS